MNEHHKTKEQIRAEEVEIESAKKDPERFSVLYDRYFKSIFVFIFRRTDDEELTADLSQHVFLKAMVNLPRYKSRGLPFSAWLFRIALNEVNMYFRNTNKERTVSLELNALGGMIAEAKEEDNEENRKLLMIALGRLKPDEIQLIELRFFEEHAFAEIGAITGITENNAKVKLYRVLSKLKEMLKGKLS